MIGAASDLQVRGAKRQSSKSLRVLLAAWAPFRAGAEVAAERLAVGLQEAGHRVTVVVGTQGETLERLRDAHLDARFVPLAFTDKRRWWRYHASQRALRKILVEVQPEVVHANDLPTSQMVGAAARKLGLPRVCHHRWIFGGEAIRWLNRYGAERHVFVSRALRDELCSVSSELTNSPCEIVYDGLTLPNVPTPADRAEARRRLELADDTRVVLFAGQIIERKGVADLIRAWKLLSPGAARRSELVLIGDDLEGNGNYRRNMESLAAQEGCSARFMGSQRNVSEWIAAADVCVVPSHLEPLGNATLEAMAHGRPVIGSDVGGIPEMIVNGETGLLVPPRDPTRLAAAIEKLIHDEEHCSKLGQAARERCECKFSLAQHVDAVVNAYRHVLSTYGSVVA